jgi:hypothetical protein
VSDKHKAKSVPAFAHIGLEAQTIAIIGFEAGDAWLDGLGQTKPNKRPAILTAIRL